MNPGHEECTAEVVEEKALMDPEPIRTILCLHDHKETVYASDGILDHAVGFHCHCCGRVWTDQNYVKGH